MTSEFFGFHPKNNQDLTLGTAISFLTLKYKFWTFKTKGSQLVAAFVNNDLVICLGFNICV